MYRSVFCVETNPELQLIGFALKCCTILLHLLGQSTLHLTSLDFFLFICLFVFMEVYS